MMPPRPNSTIRSRSGPVIGAVVYLLLEELLSQITEYWALIMGPLLLLIVLFGRGGIMGLLGRLNRG